MMVTDTHYVSQDCPDQFKFLEQTLVKSNCDVVFPPEGLNYTIPTDGTGDRSAALTTVRLFCWLSFI